MPASKPNCDCAVDERKAAQQDPSTRTGRNKFSACQSAACRCQRRRCFASLPGFEKQACNVNVMYPLASSLESFRAEDVCQ